MCIYIYIYKYYERKKGRNYIPLLFHAKIDLQTSIYIYIYIYIICTMENVLPFSTLYSRPDAFRHLPSSGALTCNCYRVVIQLSNKNTSYNLPQLLSTLPH